MSRMIYALGLLFLAACSKHEQMPQVMFFGECQMEITANLADAEILVDGVEAGKGRAAFDIPCGEKQIRVERHGYRPYFAYVPVAKTGLVKVAVTMEKQPDLEIEALKPALVAKMRERPVVIEAAATPGAAGKAGAATAAPVGPAPGEDWSKVEAWL